MTREKEIFRLHPAGRLLRIGELAAQAHITVQTLRFYERQGLVPQAVRSASNYRLYPVASVQRVSLIKQAQSLGFSLKEIKRILARYDAGLPPHSLLCSLGQERLRSIQAEIARLEHVRDSLAGALRVWRSEPRPSDHADRSASRQPRATPPANARKASSLFVH